MLLLADGRYPVVPEVGKIGKSDGSYILPVAERKDGIKSFFAKQSPKKAPAMAGKPPPKPISKAELMGEGEAEAEAEAKPDVKTEVKEEAKPDVKEEAKPDVKEEANPEVKEESKLDGKPDVTPDNKPDPSPEVIDVDAEPSSQGKRKREPDRRGGRQTKVARPEPKDKSGQKPITAFFKSPRK
jgi:hypothetical protein